MKTCTACGLPKELEAFNRSTRNSDGRQSWCRQCMKTKNNGDYRDLPGRKDAIRATGLAHRRSMVTWNRTLKDMQPCTDCGVAYPWYVMQWDHIGDDKNFSVSAEIQSGMSRRRVASEIAKCELVCANCHSVRTYVRRAGVEPASSGLESDALPLS